MMRKGHALLKMAMLLCVLVLWPVPSQQAKAQHNHAQHHNSYVNWANKDNKGCCNDRDCGEVHEGEERTTAHGIEVFVRGVGTATGQDAWCPVLTRHYLSRGNAPNWTTSHMCVSDYYGGKTPCEQFICYQPKPLF